MQSIIIMQEAMKKEQLTDAERSAFILSLNKLTKTIIQDAIANENKADELLQSEGLAGTQYESKEMMNQDIEDIINNCNQLNRIRTELKNREHSM